MHFLKVFAALTFAGTAYAITGLCPGAFVTDTRIIQGASGVQINTSTIACPDGQNPLLDRREFTAPSTRDALSDLSRKDVSECTISPCFCGTACGTFSCSSPGGPITVLDCETLINELLTTSGTFIVPPLQAQTFELASCAYVAVNEFPTVAAQFCFDDVAHSAIDVLDSCVTNAGQCIGDAGAYVLRQVFP